MDYPSNADNNICVKYNSSYNKQTKQTIKTQLFNNFYDSNLVIFYTKNLNIIQQIKKTLFYLCAILFSDYLHS